MINLVYSSTILSDSLLNTADYCYRIGSRVGNNIYINLSKKNVKHVFENYVNQWIAENKTYGQNLVILDSCVPYENWRNINKEKVEKYSIIDSSIMCDVFRSSQYLQEVVEKKNRQSVYYVKSPELDSIDLKKILENTFFSSNCTFISPKFDYIISDNNKFFNHALEIENYLLQQVEKQLTQKQLI